MIDDSCEDQVNNDDGDDKTNSLAPEKEVNIRSKNVLSEVNTKFIGDSSKK